MKNHNSQNHNCMCWDPKFFWYCFVNTSSLCPNVMKVLIQLKVGLFLHCLWLQISLYRIHFYGLWSSGGNTRHALKMKNLVFLETSRQGESENRKAPGEIGHVANSTQGWTTLLRHFLLDFNLLYLVRKLGPRAFQRGTASQNPKKNDGVTSVRFFSLTA